MIADTGVAFNPQEGVLSASQEGGRLKNGRPLRREEPMKRGFRVLALAAAAALALLAVPASAGENHESSYLALGDSYAFAFNPTVSPADSQNPANFPGYTDAVANALHL